MSLLKRISSTKRSELGRGQGEEESRRTGSKVSIGSSRLDLGHLLLLQSKLTVDAGRVRSNRQRSHSKAANVRTSVSVDENEAREDLRIVWDSSMRRGSLPSREGLPPGCSTRSGVSCVPSIVSQDSEDEVKVHTGGPVHHICSTLVGSKEELRYRMSASMSDGAGDEELTISSFLYKSTTCSLIPGLWPGMRRSMTGRMVVRAYPMG